MYDYRDPTAVPDELKHAFDVVVADPPYLVRLAYPDEYCPGGQPALHACGHATLRQHINDATTRPLTGAQACANNVLVPLQSAECLEKTVETMRVLAKPGHDQTTHYLLTGAIMREHARRLLGLRWGNRESP